MKKKLNIRKNIRDILLAGATAGGLSLFMEIYRELSEFVVRRYRLRVPDPRSTVTESSTVRVVFLSDLHGKKYGMNNQDLIQAVKEEKPDYILIGGDLVTRSHTATDETAASLVCALSKLCPVYLANGNHEQKMRMFPEKYGDRYERYMDRVKAAGVCVLENGSADMDMKGVPVQITGLELPLKCYARFDTKRLMPKEIAEAVGQPKKDRYQILMAHNPVHMAAYHTWGADLTLSGHLHGGIIGLPGIGGLITPQATLFPKYAGGIYQERKHTAIVSRGLGTHTVNLRFLNPAEIVSVTLEFCPCEKPENQV